MNWSLVTTWKFFIQAHPLTSRVNNEVLKGGVTMKVVPLVQHYFHMMLLAFLQFTNDGQPQVNEMKILGPRLQ